MIKLLRLLFSKDKQEVILSQIEEDLAQHGIDSYREEKTGWGQVVVFNDKGTTVFANNISLGEIDIRNYYTGNSYQLN